MQQLDNQPNHGGIVNHDGSNSGGKRGRAASVAAVVSPSKVVIDTVAKYFQTTMTVKIGTVVYREDFVMFFLPFLKRYGTDFLWKKPRG